MNEVDQDYALRKFVFRLEEELGNRQEKINEWYIGGNSKGMKKNKAGKEMEGKHTLCACRHAYMYMCVPTLL